MVFEDVSSDVKLTLMVRTKWDRWGIWAGPIGFVENPTPILLHARS